MSTLILTSIETQIHFYGNPIVIALGIIGNIFIFILFNRQRPNACSIYLMHSAITNLLYLLISGFYQIFSVSYYNQTLRALFLCKFISSYTPNFLGQVARTILILACIDRFMITSQRARIRAFSTPKRAKYFIFFSYIFWLIAASHTLIWSTTSKGQCIKVGIYATIYTFYAIFLTGLIPSFILCVIGYLTYRNVRQLHRRIQPTAQYRNNTNNSIRRRDRDLLVLVIAEAFAYIITTSLFSAIILERMISSYVMPNKSLQYVQAEIFVLNVSYSLLFVYSGVSFYTYMISSKSFRRDFKQLIMKSYQNVKRQGLAQTTRITGQRVTQRDTHV
jgi:hypothetical protein